eukprot:TRINITY_DN32605_c0_g1_i1.p1 TRINITY_DN32605_c0_g1~~TRINITY_DN32605_c0_g1_i1.p1  ORF type:complete len:415 (-),score=61.58 TRINITY_DN32605_c0_g1_i1:465-1709(-)
MDGSRCAVDIDSDDEELARTLEADLLAADELPEGEEDVRPLTDDATEGGASTSGRETLEEPSCRGAEDKKMGTASDLREGSGHSGGKMARNKRKGHVIVIEEPGLSPSWTEGGRRIMRCLDRRKLPPPLPPVVLTRSASIVAARVSAAPALVEYSGLVGALPCDVFPNILKFLSPEDLSSCSMVCNFLRLCAADDSLWRRAYSLRWGTRVRPRGLAWKQSYFERDRAEVQESCQNCPEDFRQYFVHMHAAKRSQAPRPDQPDPLLTDDLAAVEAVVAAEVAVWRTRYRLPEVYCGVHTCNGRVCSFHQIGAVYLCESTGRAHVCDENCTATVLDPDNELYVCAITGRCFDRLISAEEEAAIPTLLEEASAAFAEEGEAVFASGRLGRAYFLGYNCDDERELREAQRAMGCAITL